MAKPRGRTPGSLKKLVLDESGSHNQMLATFKVGDVRWIERTGIRPPITARTRRPPETEDWLFEAAAFMAVPQSSITDDPVRLWRIKRIA